MELKQGECVNLWLLLHLFSMEMELATQTETHANTQTNVESQAYISEHLNILTNTGKHTVRIKIQ